MKRTRRITSFFQLPDRRNWKLIASYLDGKTEVQCLHRVVELVAVHGAKKWSVIANHLPGRIGKQCRERWHNHLNPDTNKTAWSEEEDRNILGRHQKLGDRWAEIAKNGWAHVIHRNSQNPLLPRWRHFIHASHLSSMKRKVVVLDVFFKTNVASTSHICSWVHWSLHRRLRYTLPTNINGLP